MKNIKVIHFDFCPKQLIRSLSNFRCNIELVFADLTKVDVNCDIILLVLPRYGFNEWLSFLSSLLSSVGVPVFVIDFEYNPYNKNQSLDLGADLYFSLPISPDDLYKYISYRIGFNQEKKELVNYKDLSIDLARRTVIRAGKNFSLRRKEFDLLHFLLLNPGIVHSKQKILEAVWDMNADCDTMTVASHISSLRRKVDNGFENKYLHTIYCVGYMID